MISPIITDISYQTNRKISTFKPATLLAPGHVFKSKIGASNMTKRPGQQLCSLSDHFVKSPKITNKNLSYGSTTLSSVSKINSIILSNQYFWILVEEILVENGESHSRLRTTSKRDLKDPKQKEVPIKNYGISQQGSCPGLVLVSHLWLKYEMNSLCDVPSRMYRFYNWSPIDKHFHLRLSVNFEPQSGTAIKPSRDKEHHIKYYLVVDPLWLI